MKNEDIFIEAKKRVKAKKGFVHHAIAYVMVIAMLSAMSYFGDGGFLMPMIVAFGWGIGLASHYFNTFGTEHLGALGFNSNWEEEQIEKEIEQLVRKRELKKLIEEEKTHLEDLDRIS